MTFEEFWSAFVFDNHSFSHRERGIAEYAWDQGQLAMRERAARKAEALTLIPQHIVTGIRNLQPE